MNKKEQTQDDTAMKTTLSEKQARKIFERDARFMRDGVYGIRIGHTPTFITAADTEELWKKFLKKVSDFKK